jgi:hypothetical protein
MWSGTNSLPPGQATCRPCRKAQRETAKPKPPKEPRPSKQIRNCEVCGKTYKYSYYEQRTCGRICGQVIAQRTPKARTRWPSSPVWIEPCTVCGQLGTFRRRQKVRICSEQCAKERNRQRDRKRDRQRDRPRVPLHPCSTCGQGQLKGNARYCTTCKRRRKRQQEHKRQRLKNGVPSDNYTLNEIAQRDKNMCGLCRKRVAMTKTVPHPKAPTIDHVLPLAKGGHDTRANVQLAHFHCNSLKQSGGTQQLALI